MMTDDASLALSRFASGLSLAVLPEPVVSVLKRQVLDTLGVMLAASGIGEGCPEVLALVARQGGAPEASVLGIAGRVPVTAAAFANGALAHALDFDDLYDPGIAHVAAATVPAALAAAEASAVPVSGADFLAALAAGGEVICRLSRAAMADDGAVPTKLASQVFGYFGAAAAAGRVLRLTPERMHSALGLALMQAAGTMEIVHATGSVGKCVYEAFSNQGGVQSALLADLGLPAAAASLEGEAGLFRAHFDGRYVRGALVDGLGERFLLADVSFKPWPASKVTHPFVQAGLELAAREAVRADAVEAIVVHVGPWGRAFCEPLAERARPHSSSTAKNSIPFTLAKALAHGRLTLADFTAAGLDDPAAHAIADRVRPRFVAALASAAGTEAGVVEIRTAGGVRSARVDLALGHPSRPLDLDAIAAKFRDCATYARVCPPASALDGCVDLVARLPSVPDVRALLSPLRV